MKEDAIEKPRHPMRGAIAYASVLQLLWGLLYSLMIFDVTSAYEFPTGSHFGYVPLNSLAVAVALFWLFVVYLTLARGRKVTKGDLLVITYGSPIFSLVTLFIMSALHAIRYGEWPNFGLFLR